MLGVLFGNAENGSEGVELGKIIGLVDGDSLGFPDGEQLAGIDSTALRPILGRLDGKSEVVTVGLVFGKNNAA